MLAVHIFVMGGANRVQFVAAASNEPETQPESRALNRSGWTYLTTILRIDLFGQPLRVHLCDGRFHKLYVQDEPSGMALGGWDWEVLVAGYLGFIVLDDGSPEAKSDREFVRAYTPTPCVVLEEKRFDITSTEAIRQTVLALLDTIYRGDDWE